VRATRAKGELVITTSFRYVQVSGLLLSQTQMHSGCIELMPHQRCISFFGKVAADATTSGRRANVVLQMQEFGLGCGK